MKFKNLEPGDVFMISGGLGIVWVKLREHGDVNAASDSGGLQWAWEGLEVTKLGRLEDFKEKDNE